MVGIEAIVAGHRPPCLLAITHSLVKFGANSSPHAVTVYPHATILTEPSHRHQCAAINATVVRLAGARQPPLLPSSVHL
jgi:hypothetical protein